jgi:DNA-binding response OmpR family regulator
MSHRHSLCLIEDHKTLWKLTQQELQNAWYTCDRYKNWDEAIKIEQYDCFVLDVMLPWIDGFEIWKKIRERSEIWIIYLTAKIQLEDKIVWFEVWADDYLTKPFAMKELTLRIDALLQRIPTHSILLNSWIRIDSSKRAVTNTDGSTIHCTPIERHVLTELTKNHWQPCSRVDLVEAWWWEDSLFSMSRSLDVTIANLRSKLWKETIITIPKVGYQIY